MLGSRAVLRVGGADARSWLQGLVTNDVEHIPAGEARFAALLTRRARFWRTFSLSATATGCS